MKLEWNLVLTKGLDGFPDVDLVPVDVDPVLGLEGDGHILVGDGAERLVLGSDLQTNNNRLVADLVRQRLSLRPVLRLASAHSRAQTLGLGFDTPKRRHRQLARKQEVATIAVGDLLDVTGLADVVDVLGQHHAHVPSPPPPMDMNRLQLRPRSVFSLACPPFWSRGGRPRQYLGG